MIRKKVYIEKRSFRAGTSPSESVAEAPSDTDLDARQEATSVRRRLGGAEARDDDEDRAMVSSQERKTESAKPIEIVGHD